MEDEPRNGTNSTIFKLDSLGNANINGYARVIYMYNSYNERDWKVKIDGHKIHDRRTGEPVYHKIVEEYKEALIREIPDIKSRIMEEDQVNNHSNNYYSRSL
jgi:hypothetical protein